jgi:septal ring factor EnvC (AmiA/AmiB activator)
MGANLTNEIADGAGLNPERQHLLRQLKAGEKVLTKVRQEKNDLQDANTKLGVELKDVRAQLSDSMKENQRLRRGIFSKCLNEPFEGKFGGQVD